MAAHGHFHWNELLTRDAERAKRFYSDTIGWTFDAMPMPDGATYWVAKMGGQPVAGLFPTNRPEFEGVPEAWMSYLAVDDVDARVKKAVAAGAKLMKPDLRRAACRADRHPDRARRRRCRLDDAGRMINHGKEFDHATAQDRTRRTNGSPRARRSSQTKRNSPRRATS